jgi:hypothetical protein
MTVKAGLWDCPSCGLDKRRSLVQMCEDAGCDLMLTLTFEQPRSVVRGVRVVPPGFERCSEFTHVRWYVDTYGKGSFRWLRLSTCVYCCRKVSKMVDTFNKSVRRRWPDFEFLRVIEDHKSGAMHLHSGVVGVLGDLSDARDVLRSLWRAAGGGRQVDLAQRSSERVGRYLGKYLGKTHDQRMAHGYRRWSRSRNFGGSVLMAWSQAWRRRRAAEVAVVLVPALVAPVVQVLDVDGPPLVRVGWVHPAISSVVTRVRLWPETVAT